MSFYDSFGEGFSSRPRPWSVPGLIRMNRAMPFLQQRLREVIGDIERRTTKTLAEAYYRVIGFGREVENLARMSGDHGLIELVGPTIRNLNQRTNRREASDALKTLLANLEAYVPVDPLAGFEAEEKISDDRSMASAAQVSGKQVESQKSVFVIMPFAVEFTDVWKGGIDKAAKTEGFTAIRVDMINRSSNITDDIVNTIEKCHLAIVDVTNNNPNVMFELGYAMAKNKKNIIISQSAEFLPFDIRNIRTIVYKNSWAGIEELRTKIQDFLKESAPSKHGRRAKS